MTCRVAYVVDLDELRVPRDVRASLTPNELFASLQEILLCAKGDEVPQPWSMLVAQNIVLSGEAGILTNLLARLALRCIIRDVVPELRVPVVQTTCSLVNDFQKNDESELACMMTFMMSHGRTSYGTPQVNNLIAAVTLTHNGLGHMLAHTIEVFTTFLTEDGAIDQYRLRCLFKTVVASQVLLRTVDVPDVAHARDALELVPHPLQKRNKTLHSIWEDYINDLPTAFAIADYGLEELVRDAVQFTQNDPFAVSKAVVAVAQEHPSLEPYRCVLRVALRTFPEAAKRAAIIVLAKSLLICDGSALVPGICGVVACAVMASLDETQNKTTQRKRKAGDAPHDPLAFLKISMDRLIREVAPANTIPEFLAALRENLCGNFMNNVVHHNMDANAVAFFPTIWGCMTLAHAARGKSSFRDVELAPTLIDDPLLCYREQPPMSPRMARHVGSRMLFDHVPDCDDSPLGEFLRRHVKSQKPSNIAEVGCKSQRYERVVTLLQEYESSVSACLSAWLGA